tara:strand:- start:6917 stop:7651 length:735 start_codon:yes stop_codon:yes gene_type:complete
MESKFKMPTEIVELPSKGLLYQEDSPLSKGEIEMKYMTAKEEDILTNNNYIANGTVIDKLLKALIITKDVDFNDLLIGDKNAIMVAARILAYGKNYNITYGSNTIDIDLSTIENTVIDYTLLKDRKNEFEYQLPQTKNTVTFKLLTHKDERDIENEMNGLKKLNKDSSTESTTRLKHTITSVNGISETKDIREFVDKYLLATDARALRKYMTSLTPDVDLRHYPEGVSEGVDLPIGIGFFWPDI